MWLVLGLRDLVRAWLRAGVLSAEALDDGGVTVRAATSVRRWRYDELSEVRVRRGRTRLVTRDGAPTGSRPSPAPPRASGSRPASWPGRLRRCQAALVGSTPIGPVDPPTSRSAGGEQPDPSR